MRHKFALVLFLLVSACTDESRAARILRAQGYKNVTIEGYRWFSCSKDDTYHTGFSAVAPSGEAVEGVVCCGIMKNCTVRLD